MSMMFDRVFTLSIKEVSHMKLLLASWYGFLQEKFDEEELGKEDFHELLKTNVIYNLKDDNIELMLSGTDDLLNEFKHKVLD